jgi:hypothetical protein
VACLLRVWIVAVFGWILFWLRTPDREGGCGMKLLRNSAIFHYFLSLGHALCFVLGLNQELAVGNAWDVFCNVLFVILILFQPPLAICRLVSGVLIQIKKEVPND